MSILINPRRRSTSSTKPGFTKFAIYSTAVDVLVRSPNCSMRTLRFVSRVRRRISTILSVIVSLKASLGPCKTYSLFGSLILRFVYFTTAILNTSFRPSINRMALPVMTASMAALAFVNTVTEAAPKTCSATTFISVNRFDNFVVLALVGAV